MEEVGVFLEAHMAAVTDTCNLLEAGVSVEVSVVELAAHMAVRSVVLAANKAVETLVSSVVRTVVASEVWMVGTVAVALVVLAYAEKVVRMVAWLAPVVSDKYNPAVVVELAT